MGFDLKGFPELESAMERTADLLSVMRGSTAAQDALKKPMKIVVRAARANVHKVTGNLQRGIDYYVKISAEDGSMGEMGVSYKRKKNAHHAHLVEYGHANFNQHGGPYGKTPARPFWEPALQAHKDEMLEALDGAVDKVLAKAWM